jgi:hypothetical protein
VFRGRATGRRFGAVFRAAYGVNLQPEGVLGDNRGLHTWCAPIRAGVVELVDAPDSKSGAARRVGSSPTFGTNTLVQMLGQAVSI